MTYCPGQSMLFSPGSKADLIVKFFIEHQVYDIDAVNYALDEYDLPILS